MHTYPSQTQQVIPQLHYSSTYQQGLIYNPKNINFPAVSYVSQCSSCILELKFQDTLNLDGSGEFWHHRTHKALPLFLLAQDFSTKFFCLLRGLYLEICMLYLNLNI